MSTEQVVWVMSGTLDEHRCRLLKESLDASNENGGIPSVDDPVVEPGREVHHVARNEIVSIPNRTDLHLVHTDDGHLWVVDDGSGDETTKGAEGRDGDGRAGQVPPIKLPLLGDIGETLDLFGAAPNVTSLRVAENRSEERR